LKAKECLELANRTNEYHVKVSLKELAQKLNRDARKAERGKRDLAISSNLEVHP
jgi:hypothetical protein